MPPPTRRTLITYGRLAMRELRLKAARERVHGLQIMTIEQFAARLAGGFLLPIDKDRLRAAIQTALPKADLGELESIKMLPGFVRAAVDTLSKAWLSGIDLEARSSEHTRIAAIANLEKAVLAELPANLLRPADLAAKAQERLQHARAIFGDIEIQGLTELSPCWLDLLQELGTGTGTGTEGTGTEGTGTEGTGTEGTGTEGAGTEGTGTEGAGTEGTGIKMRWIADARKVPDWLDTSRIEVDTSEPQTPNTQCVSAATAYHEAIEAVRWARELIASGKAQPHEIAIAATATADYDDHLLALRSDANLDIHFAHGVRVAASREGQAAAALADILLRGLSQTRIRRLARFLSNSPEPFNSLPKGWMRIMPGDAPLTTMKAWTNLINGLTPDDWPEQDDKGAQLLTLIALLDKGKGHAREIGEDLLKGLPLTVWRKALLLGPPASLELSIETLRKDDLLDPCSSIIWAPASSLAASPRPYVYLLGLNSQRWPHVAFEDRLLSDHIIPTSELEPLPINAADTRDFETILATTASEVVLSRARRDSEGRLLGSSALLQNYPDETYLRRHRVPEHALSETDRLTARREEFQDLPQAKSASTCWRNWHRYQEITPHDGLIRPDHPVIQAILARTQSASSLRLLLRNPIGFVWRYGMSLQLPKSGEDPLTLDALAMGELVHQTLERALIALEADSGFAKASEDEIRQAVGAAATSISHAWELERPVPPRSVWGQTLADARMLGERALTLQGEEQPMAQAFAEVPFGGADAKSQAPLPWSQDAPVEVPGAGFSIRGYIDRLDLSSDRRTALVRDYKTGKAPRVSDTRPFILDQGKELQRCLYAYAVKAMLGEATEIRASLHYLREDCNIALEEPEATLEDLATYLKFAKDSLTNGGCTIGAGSGDTYDDLAFALPANAANIYCMRKMAAVKETIGQAADVWEAG